MRRDFEILGFSTYTDKYCFAYMKCAFCGALIGRTIDNVSIVNPRKRNIGDTVTSNCYCCDNLEGRQDE